jgi:hypothetical protein
LNIRGIKNNYSGATQHIVYSRPPLSQRVKIWYFWHIDKPRGI